MYIHINVYKDSKQAEVANSSIDLHFSKKVGKYRGIYGDEENSIYLRQQLFRAPHMKKTTIILATALLCHIQVAYTQILTGVGIGAEVDPADEGSIPDPGYFILDCGNDSLGALPLVDLGVGYYMGYQGGLFPGGSNTDPNPHLNNGKNISKAIKPLNASGIVDYINGEVSLIGIGPSVASDPYNEWKETQNDLDWPGVNPCLNVKGNFIGGKSVADMLDIDGTYWASFLAGLDSKNIDPLQVQVAWMLLVSSTDSNDVNYYVDTVTNQYIQVLHNLQTLCPNLQEVFISGIHYTGYTSPEHKRYDYLIEPYGYWSNLVVKNVISLQINGDTRLTYSGVGKVAPFITWGPYFWADGVTPRAYDGLLWSCDNFRDDTIGGGFHLKDTFKFKEGDLIDSFFINNPVAKIWYKNAAAWSACGTGRMADADDMEIHETGLHMYPSPAHDQINVQLPEELTGVSEILVYNNVGALIERQQFDARTYLNYSVDIHALPAGLYYIQLKDAHHIIAGRFVKE